MKQPDIIDFTLQAGILRLGQLLSDSSSPPVLRQTSVRPEMMASEIERVLALIRASQARRLMGIERNFVTDNDVIRLKAFAVVAWRMVSEPQPCTSIQVVSSSIVDPGKPYCEQLLICRDVLGRMVGERLLTLVVEGGGSSRRLLLPRKVFSWVAGGAKSYGDFSPAKLGSAKLNRNGEDDSGTQKKALPTARQLFDAVRQEVIGIDPQLRVLASRFALHAIRAEALKAGTDCTDVPQMCVCLIADSGVGKSFTVSRFAKKIGLGLCQYDSTVLTGQGYVGADIDEPYRLLVNSVGGDADEASRGIIFLDEFSAKANKTSGREGGRDVSTLAIQQELLCKLQATAPFVIGGKRQFDAQPFLFDGRRTGYILGGTFEGLDEIILKMQGRRDIGFASEVGCRKFVDIQSAMVEAGFIRPLVNRISTVIRLPTPTVETVHRAINGIVNGFNSLLYSRGIILETTESASRLIAGYSVESLGYFRSVKAVLTVITDDLLFNDSSGAVNIGVSEVRQAISRLTTGIVDGSQSEDGVAAAIPDCELDAQPEKIAGG